MPATLNAGRMQAGVRTLENFSNTKSSGEGVPTELKASCSLSGKMAGGRDPPRSQPEARTKKIKRGLFRFYTKKNKGDPR